LRHCAIRSFISTHGITDLDCALQLIGGVFEDSNLNHEHTKELFIEIMKSSIHLFDSTEVIDGAQIELWARYVSLFSEIFECSTTNVTHKKIIEKFSHIIARRAVDVIA
jgi:hypothetical protein